MGAIIAACHPFPAACSIASAATRSCPSRRRPAAGAASDAAPRGRRRSPRPPAPAPRGTERQRSSKAAVSRARAGRPPPPWARRASQARRSESCCTSSSSNFMRCQAGCRAARARRVGVGRGMVQRMQGLGEAGQPPGGAARRLRQQFVERLALQRLCDQLAQGDLADAGGGGIDRGERIGRRLAGATARRRGWTISAQRSRRASPNRRTRRPARAVSAARVKLSQRHQVPLSSAIRATSWRRGRSTTVGRAPRTLDLGGKAGAQPGGAASAGSRPRSAAAGGSRTSRGPRRSSLASRPSAPTPGQPRGGCVAFNRRSFSEGRGGSRARRSSAGTRPGPHRSGRPRQRPSAPPSPSPRALQASAEHEHQIRLDQRATRGSARRRWHARIGSAKQGLR